MNLFAVERFGVADGKFQRIGECLLAAQQNALLTRRDATPQLATITCPTLVLCGREDTWSGPPQHEVMHHAIAGSVLRIIEHCGHMCTLEQPEAVTQALAEWLGALAVH